MSGAFHQALATLERSGQSPAGFCTPFLDVFPVSGASVATVGDLLGSETLSASDALAARLDELQFDLGEGPCWDALTTGRPILEPDLKHARTAWPAFSAAVAHDDISSIFAFPLSVGPLRMGAIDLFSLVPVSLNRTQTRQADAMAGVVSRHVLRRALAAVDHDEETGVEVGNAYSRRLLHQATGMVLAQLGVSADDARLVIHGHAFAVSRPVIEVAQDVLDGRLNFAMRDDGIEEESQ
ncbi:MAG TPA: GAF and ANTAR domain-containing protein [Agromyces sp.]|nr:GAF and ANTAR domain-containing protein [Agromyces sp.]